MGEGKVAFSHSFAGSLSWSCFRRPQRILGVPAGCIQEESLLKSPYHAWDGVTIETLPLKIGVGDFQIPFFF